MFGASEHLIGITYAVVTILLSINQNISAYDKLKHSTEVIDEVPKSKKINHGLDQITRLCQFDWLSWINFLYSVHCKPEEKHKLMQQLNQKSEPLFSSCIH